MKKIIIISLLQFNCLYLAAKPNLVLVKNVNPSIKIETVYATSNNFTNEVIYECSKCYVLQEVAVRLNEIQKELAAKGLGLKVWDGYRPLSAQKKMWDVCAQQFPDENERENYVTNPAKGGGRHTRGTTVDLTIIDLATGKELDMGTGFDDFSKRAWRDCPELSAQVKKNRAILDAVMEKHGFKGIKAEWWHFDLNNWQQFEPLDVALSQLD